MECLLTITQFGKLKKIPITKLDENRKDYTALLVDRSIVLGVVFDEKDFAPLDNVFLSPIEKFLKGSSFNNLQFVQHLANKDDYREERELFLFTMA